MINQSNVTGDVSLFTVPTGQGGWWSLQLLAALVSGQGAAVSIRVNDVEPPTTEGGFFTYVDETSYPTRQNSKELLLDVGDVVSAHIDGGYVNLSLSGLLLTDEL